MIVKNEAHILIDCFKMLSKYITFDYWVINDNGSTDGTQKLIKDYFAEQGIPGELDETPWKDFAFNRTRAFEVAYKKTDYAFVWDADDEISGDFVMPELTGDSYKFIFGNAEGFRYSRPQLFNNNLKWCYKGVLHEYADCLEKAQPTLDVPGDYYFISGRRGDRSKDPNKYLKDALVLEKASEEALVAKDPLYNRYIFYCAQSYTSCGMREKAIEFYKKALTLPLWIQEKYISCLEIFDAYDALKKPEEGLRYLVESHSYDSTRIECIYRLIKHYCIQHNNRVAFMYYTLIQDYYENRYLQSDLPSKLFVKQSEYDFYMPYYMIIVSEGVKRFDITAKMYTHIVKYKYLHIGEWWIRNLIHNMQFCIKELPYTLEFFHNLMDYITSLQARGIVLEASQIAIISKTIDHFKPLLTQYPELPAFQINSTPKILFTFTTCKRFDLFEKTMNSILHTWTDIEKVDYFFCVDDNSRQVDRSKMTKAYPFIDFYMKKASEKGHMNSMNIIYNKLAELKPKYWIHMEDDWLFFKRDAYVQKSMDFLDKYENKNIHQILYNRNYTETYDFDINGGTLLEPGYLLHLKSDTITGRNSAYWPHYSFRPSMSRVSAILSLGNYESPNTFFERDYANKYFANGYMSAFFNTVTSLHIGKLTSDKSGTNAYTLNGVGQFGTIDSKKQTNFVVNLLRRTDRKEAVEVAFEKQGITDYEFFEAVDGKTLEVSEEIANLFIGNDFGNRRGVIGCALSHLTLWKQLVKDNAPFYTIYEDDISLSDDFKDKLEYAKKNVRGDMVFLGYHSYTRNHRKEESDPPIIPLDIGRYVGGYFAYIITQSGAKKLLDYIHINGIKHGIDYLVKIIPEFESFVIQPHIVLSEWVRSGDSSVDSDIQKDYNSIEIVKMINTEEWEFHEGVDSGGSDISSLGTRNLSRIYYEATKNPMCVAFNTLGFLKSKVNDLVKTPYIHSKGSGIYVKKNYTYNECMNTRLPKKNTYEISDLIGISKKCDWFIYHNGCINITSKDSPRYIFISSYNEYKGFTLFMSTYVQLLKSPFILIISGDDFTFPRGTGDARFNFCSDKQESIESLLNNPLLEKIYVENLDTLHPKLSPLPLGLIKNNLQGYHSKLEIVYNPIDFSLRNIDCFCIHRTRDGEQWETRRRVSELCKTEWKYITYVEGDTINNTQIYDYMLRSKFCMCVRGGGYDPSPKCWEALLNGCIPIIQHSPLDEVYSKFPVVFVDDWTKESITQEKLDGWLQELRPYYEDPIKRKEVLHKLSLEYWWSTISTPSQWVSCNLMGGLGNRLFQISAALGLGEKMNLPVVFYTPKIKQNPHGDSNTIHKLFPDIPLIHHVEDIYEVHEEDKDTSTYNQISISTTKPVLIHGYRQSPLYFPSKLPIHLEDIPVLQEKYNLITEKDKLNTWFIHVRLGDYITNDDVNHITIESYYRKALAYIPPNVHVLVFSDQPEKIDDLLKLLTLKYTLCNEKDEIHTLLLMSQCWGGAIVPNSTFSWWGAYLAHERSSQPEVYKAYYPSSWRKQFGNSGKGCIPSWGHCIDIYTNDEWDFYEGFDSGGNDITYLGTKDIEIIFSAATDFNCIAFNTLGFLKSKVKFPLIKSPYLNNYHGLYVKKSYTPLTRIKMLCNWCSSEDLCKEWLKMTKGSYTWNNIQITWKDDVDYYIIINKPKLGDFYIPEKTIIFHMEPWCGNKEQIWGVKTWGQWAAPDPVKFLQVRSHKNFMNTVFWQVPLTYTDFKNTTISKKNADTISTVCSSKYFDPGHKKRIDFLKYLESKGTDLHIYNEDNNHQFKSYQGKARPDIDKEKGLLPYKYYFMCENNAENNFITEKLWEPILCECLCFYWGCPNVGDYIDPLAYVQLDMDDFEKSFLIIQDAIENNLWEKRLPSIQKEKEKLLDTLGFFPVVESILKPKVVCFIHSCHLASSGTEKLDLLLENVVKIKEIDSIIINNIGLPLDSYTDSRIKVIHHSDDPSLFELPTLRMISEFSKNNPFTKVLYLHTKGISYKKSDPRYSNGLDWIHYMLHFLCTNSAESLKLLDSYDTLGCNFSENPHPHYSGNFWWATTKYLKTLSTDRLTDKMSAEWWLLSGNPNKYTLHSSGKNHFIQPYPYIEYA
jgi:GR25 family glycosyltransferase involved in LPS biosynthesis/tetratricopeptide (TPR) repeat protein